MPLSDHEQRILEEIEKNLSQEDPAFARDVTRRAPRSQEMRRIKLGSAIFAAGFVVLITFFIWRHLLLGVAAFGAMVTGLVVMAGSIRALGPPRRPNVSGPRERMAQALGRWERRLRERYRRP